MPISELNDEQWDAVVDTNLKGVFTVVKHAVPTNAGGGQGTIITVGCDPGIVAMTESPVYAARKGGVIMFTGSIAIDLVRDNICLYDSARDRR